MRVMFLTPVKVNGNQHEIFDVAEVSDEDGQDLLNKAWGVKVPDEATADSRHFSKPKPVIGLMHDPNKEKE